MPSATKAHHEPLNTTRKTESRPCCSLDNRPVTEAFPVRGLERKRGLRCYSCRSVQPTERVARRPSEHSAGGHTTHERKTNKALSMMIVEGLMVLYICKSRASKRPFVCLSGSVSLASHCLTPGPGWSFPSWVQLDRKEDGLGELVPRLSGM
ncbi:hypothetical protein FOYG_02599 [Fusarium oxysporum NRRL 32931]|uniref:Uncharacterized protein n=1 Tax=Fusarium oxysporum NRRL 32931 TaxID=660029 RepID=W9IWZ6_FUSOX|nr:hypothetical protein FOYG_02599 [Fusarium oxysporum NRRL 32931]